MLFHLFPHIISQHPRIPRNSSRPLHAFVTPSGSPKKMKGNEELRGITREAERCGKTQGKTFKAILGYFRGRDPPICFPTLPGW